METNALPEYDMNDKPTDCCPKFKPDVWDEQLLTFKNKPFLRAQTRNFFHIPLNMGSVFPKTFTKMEEANAYSDDNFVVMSQDPSAWRSEHYFAVTRDVPGEDMVEMTGEYLTKVFEGPYKDAPKWEKTMEAFVQEKGYQPQKTYFFYTTCPKCAKAYGKNYVVAISQIS